MRLKAMSDCFGDDESGFCKCFQPDVDVVGTETSEEYFTAVFNTERMDMYVDHRLRRYSLCTVIDLC